MWLINLLPDWVIHSIVITGMVGVLVGALLKYSPSSFHTRYVIMVVGYLLFTIGMFLEGVSYNEATWKAKVADVEARLAVAEKQSAEINAKISTDASTSTKKVQQAQVKIRTEIREVQTVIDAKCDIPDEAIVLHNKAAERPQ